MASVQLNLNQFTASGVYTLEFDASENIILNTQTIRLVVGFSRTGPFNAPVYLPDVKTAIRVFGDVDPFLERRGSFFHRALKTCLNVAPVYGLNLIPLNNDADRGDKVPYQSFSISTIEANGQKVFKLYSSFYNKERFWFPDETYFLGNVNSPGSINAGKMFNIVNLGQTPVSLIVKKTNPTQFNITARDWFGVGNVPSYIDEWDFISDYFVEVIIIQGNWTNYTQLSVDPIYNIYFNQDGVIKTQVANFLSLPEVTVIGDYIGSIIPDLIDGNNVTYSIDVIINAAIAETGVFVSIDRDTLENYDLSLAGTDDYDTVSGVDMVGHSFADPNKNNPDIIDFLSYKTSIKDVLGFSYKSDFTLYPVVPTGLVGSLQWHTESLHMGGNYGYFNNVVAIPKPITDNPDDLDMYKYLEYQNLLIPGDSLIKLDNTQPFAGSMTGNWGTIQQIYEEVDDTGATYLKLLWSHPNKQFEKPDEYVSGLTISTFDDTAGAMKIVLKASDMTAAQQLFWLDPAAVGANSPWAGAGEDILIQNTSTKTWYYFKLTDDPVHLSNAQEPYYIDQKGTISTIHNYHYSDDVITIYVQDNDAMTLLKRNSVGFQLYMASTANAQLEEGSIINNTYTTSVSPAFVQQPDVFKYVAATGTPSQTNPNYFVAYKYSKIYQYFLNSALHTGDQIFYGEDNSTKTWYLEYDIVKDSDGIASLSVKAFDTFINNTVGWYSTFPIGFTTAGFNITATSSVPESSSYNEAAYNMYIYGTTDQIFSVVQIIDHSWNNFKTTFQVQSAYASSIQVGQYIVAEIKSPDGTLSYKLTRVLTSIKKYSASVGTYVWEYTINQPFYNNIIDSVNNVIRYLPLDDVVLNYQLFYLDGFKMNDYHYPGGNDAEGQLEKILGVLDPANTNLTSVLKDRDIIEFRYIVDTFSGGINPNTYPKTYLTNLAMIRQKCLAIMNAPSIKEFMLSTDPRFTEEPDITNPIPILNTAYIASGGNLSLGPSYTFSLPDEANGSKFCGYFSPYLKLRENGKDIFVPPAACVSNNFVQKFINGTPYMIVAGSKRGVISDPELTGLEYNFLLEDRQYLEPMGINPIILKKGMGYLIYGNQMAYQKTSSAFNNIHVRDILITIEEAVEDLLGNYLYDFNDPATRLEIKTRVEIYLDTVRSNGGLYNFEVIMDDSNNTPDIIDQNVGIIDVHIEPARGLQKIIHRITVYKTGGIAASGSTTGA